MEEKSNQKEMEQWNDVKDNNGIVKTIIIILLIVIIVLLVGFMFMKKDELFSSTINKNNQNEKSTKENEKTNSSEEIKDIDLSKSLNTKEYNYTELTSKNQNLGITIKINDDKKSVTITYNSKAQETLSSVTHSTYAKDQEYSNEIKGFNKKIKDTYIGGIGQDITGTILFFITEDNTIQYVKLFDKKTDTKGNTYWTTYWGNGEDNINIQNVDDVDGIVKLYGANANAPESTGYYTTLAAKTDGSFYDLSKIID